MAKSRRHSTSLRSVLSELFIILITVAILGVSLLLLRLDITLTLVLLPGVWVLDLYLKEILGFGNETVFADLSFAALMFVSSQGIGLIAAHPLSNLDGASLVQLFIITFILLILWIGNLSFCRPRTDKTLKEPDKIKTRHGMVLSAFCAVISTVFVLAAQGSGLI